MYKDHPIKGKLPILQVTNLVKCYGGLIATDHANLEVHTGSIHALIGPNGAGKTTLIQQISGALSPEHGAIFFDGVDITVLPAFMRVRYGLARTYQITSIFKKLSVVDNIALPVMSISGGGFNLWSSARNDEARYQRSREIASRVGLGNRLDSIAGALSHGEQRLVELGIALATEPKLLLLDEPMAGLGSGESERMLELLRALTPSLSILLVEHDMDAVFRLADTISVLVFGKVIASGSAQQIKENPDVIKAYLGDGNEEIH